MIPSNKNVSYNLGNLVLPLLLLATLVVVAKAGDVCSYGNQLCDLNNQANKKNEDENHNNGAWVITSPTNHQVFKSGIVKMDVLLQPNESHSKICFKYVHDSDCEGSEDAEEVREMLRNQQEYVTCSPKLEGNMQLGAGCWVLQFDLVMKNSANNKIAVMETEFRSVTVTKIDDEVQKYYPQVSRIQGGESGIVQMSLHEMMKGGLVLEFGSGRTTLLLSAHLHSIEDEFDTITPITITEGAHTFDSFHGLPERWRKGFEKGRFALGGMVPQHIVDLPNVQAYSGLVQETLPSFLIDRPSQPVSLLLLDMCLESSTAFILEQVACRLVKGSVVLFANYFNYPEWVETKGERTAWLSAVERYGIDFEYLGYHSSFLALRVTKKPKLCPAPSLNVRSFRRLGNVSVEDFEEKYARPEVALPTIFENITNDVFEASHWTRQALADVCGDYKIIQRYNAGCSGDDAGKNRACHHIRAMDSKLLGKEWGGLGVVDVDKLKIKTVQDLLSLQDTEDGSDLVLFDAPILHHCPPARDWIHVPKYFSRDYYLIRDWMENRDPVDTRNWPSVIVSKKGKGTFLHADSGITRFWAQQLSGSKLWRVFPPSENWRLYPTGGLHHYYPAMFKVDAMEPDFETFPLLDGAIVYETIIKPGEVLFIPEGWSHQILNLEDSVSTGMNYLDNHCLETAKKHGKSVLPALDKSFFMPLDNPTRHSPEENIEFNDYFQFRFLRKEERVPASVKRWVQEKGKKGIDSEWDVNGEPALHVAVAFDFLAVVKYLLEEGEADVNTKSRSGFTALDVAEQFGHQETRDLLIKFGAKRAAPGRKGAEAD